MLWRSTSPARRPPGFIEPCLPTVADTVRKAPAGIRLSDHLATTDGDTLFHHACAMGLEGIVAKRRDRPYRSGRSPDWIKVKNPDAPAVTRLIEG